MTLESTDGLKRVTVVDSENNTGRFVYEGLLVVDTTNGYGGIDSPYVPDDDSDDPEIPVTIITVAGAAGVGILGFIILVLRRILKG